jgi:hypothetical protein
MKYITALAGLIAVLGTGCGTLVNHSQYHILPPATQPKGAVVPAGEREAVKQVLQAVAEQFHLEDRTKTSIVPNVIGAYSERDELYPITLTAWVHGSSIVIDVLHQPYSVGETPKYRNIRDRVFKLIEERFGNRVVLPSREQQVTRVPAVQ